MSTFKRYRDVGIVIILLAVPFFFLRANMKATSSLNALDRVSVLIAENVFVITATNKLISQKLSTIRQVMKKKQDMKNSESITLYINVDH